MKRFKITFSYDGTNFYGYQKQPHKRTVQGEIESALKYINNGKKTPLTSSGRTDAKVHAINQVGHADISVDITEYKLKRAINSLTEDDIHVKSAEIVDSDFHARYMVKSKEYIYKINLGEYSPVDRNYVYQYCKSLNINKMKEATKYFVGEHDFKAFCSLDEDKNTIRTIYSIDLDLKDDILVIRFKGSGFLKYMVRIMVGALIRVGEEKVEPIEIKKVMDKKERTKTFFTSSPCGLYLKNVNY